MEEQRNNLVSFNTKSINQSEITSFPRVHAWYYKIF